MTAVQVLLGELIEAVHANALRPATTLDDRIAHLCGMVAGLVTPEPLPNQDAFQRAVHDVLARLRRDEVAIAPSVTGGSPVLAHTTEFKVPSAP